MSKVHRKRNLVKYMYRASAQGRVKVIVQDVCCPVTLFSCKHDAFGIKLGFLIANQICVF